MARRRSSNVVFNIYSLTVGRQVDIQPSPGHPKYGSDLAVVEVIKDQRVKRVRWRLSNCQQFTPRNLLARQAFLLLARTLHVPPRRLERPRQRLWRHGFSRNRQRVYAAAVWRHCRRQLSLAKLSPQMTCNQVVAAVLAGKPLTTSH